MDQSKDLLRFENVAVRFPVTGGVLGRIVSHVDALRGASATLARGEILAVVGESGSGKSTLASALVGLVPWQAGGQLWWDGQALDPYNNATFVKLRDRMQLVFQDPFSSLNPRHTLREILCYPLQARGVARSACETRMRRVLDQVGMAAADVARFPHALSGGQRQRIGIARALMLEPQVLLCDEVTSALDVSVQAQILVLLDELRRELGLAMMFISHDLMVVRALADKVMVMRNGQCVEEGATSVVLSSPREDYTRKLLDSVPTLGGI